MGKPPLGTDPAAAVRGDFRASVRDLSDALLSGAGRNRLRDAVRHTWILADLAGVEDGILRVLLRNLARDLHSGRRLDSPYYANQLTYAADALDG